MFIMFTWNKQTAEEMSIKADANYLSEGVFKIVFDKDWKHEFIQIKVPVFLSNVLIKSKMVHLFMDKTHFLDFFSDSNLEFDWKQNKSLSFLKNIAFKVKTSCLLHYIIGPLLINPFSALKKNFLCWR